MDDLHRLAVSRGYEGPLPSLELALRLDRVASDLIERLRLSGEADELLGATPLPESAPTDDGAARDDPEAVCAQLLESEAARTQRLLREARLRSERETRYYQEQRRGVDAHRDSIRASLSKLSSMLGTLGRVWGRALDPAAGAGFDCAGDSLLESLSSLLDAASKGASGEGTADAPEREERRWLEQAAELQRLQRALTAAMSGAARACVASARLQAELGALEEAQKAGGAPPAAAPEAEHSAAPELQVQLAEEVRRVDARCADEVAACAGQALSAQCCDRLQGVQQRCAAKRMVLAALARHVAGQALLLRSQEHQAAAVQHALALATAAEADAAAVLGACERRCSLQRAQQAEQQKAGGPQPAEASLGWAGGAPSGCKTDEPVAAALGGLRQLLHEMQGRLLPAQRAQFARLRHLTHAPGAGAAGLSRPELSWPGIAAAEQQAASATDDLQRQASAVLLEVAERRKHPRQRELAERVLIDFFTAPERLAAGGDAGR